MAHTNGEGRRERGGLAWLVGISALLAGAVAISVGIGVGARRLSAGMTVWRSAAALVALAVGVALTVIGIARLTAHLRTLRRVLVSAALLLVSAILVWTTSPAVIAVNVPDVALDASQFSGLGGREVRFSAEDGSTLWAWYVPPADGRVVVVRHGSGSTAEDVIPQATVLLDNGFGVLLTDARGHGRSGGPGMDFGWFGEGDISAAVSFLSTLPEVDRIALLGMSMGGEEAIGAAGSDSRIGAVVAEGATARVDSDKAWLEDEYGWRGWLQVRLEWLQYSLADLLTPAGKPPPLAEAVAGAAPTPILIITAGSVPDEEKAAFHVRAAAPGNVTVWTIPGAGHIGGLATDPAGWERRVVEFLQTALPAGR